MKKRQGNITCTVSAYNILYLEELIKWARYMHCSIYFNLLQWPVFQHISVLTPKLQRQSIENLNHIITVYRLSESEKNSITAFIKILASSKDNERSISLRKQLKEYTLTLDRWRNEDASSVFPELVGELI